MARQEEFFVYLARWVLQDGNYSDFAVGERRQFALEFGYRRSNRLQPCAASAPDLQHTGFGAWYTVDAEVVTDMSGSGPRAFVLDCGLLAYSETLVMAGGGEPSAGEWLRGDISLSVDYFSYMTWLGKVERVPPLIYTWEIVGIEVDVSPTLTIEVGHPLYRGPDEGPMLVRDPEQQRYESVECTDMWADNDRIGDYRLRCVLLDDEPERTMRRSGDRSPYGPL